VIGELDCRHRLAVWHATRDRTFHARGNVRESRPAALAGGIRCGNFSGPAEYWDRRAGDGRARRVGPAGERFAARGRLTIMIHQRFRAARVRAGAFVHTLTVT
jgi:hypothetical protein